MNKRNQKITTGFVIVSLLLIGVIYAILQANLQINGIAKIKSNSWDIHFDNVQINGNSVSLTQDDSAAAIDPNDTSKVDFSITLGVPGDFYEFTVDVVNAGSIDGMIGELIEEMVINGDTVSEIPDYLNYTVKYDGGDPILVKHLLEAGQTLTYKVRLEFRTDLEELPEATTISSTFGVEFIQADDTSIKKLPFLACTFDGEMVQGAEYVNGQYTFRYMQDYSTNAWKDITTDGWGVHLTDPTSTDPVTTRLCTTINDKPIVSMSNMFFSSQTTSIDTSSFNTSNVVDMTALFYGVSGLTSIDVSNFDTSNVNVFSAMFYNCSGLTSIDVSSFNTTSASQLSAMFLGCSSLTSLDLSNFDTTNFSYIGGLLYNCSSLTSLNMSNWDFSFLSSFSFTNTVAGSNHLRSLKTINLTNAIFPADSSTMFLGLNSVEEIILDNVNTSSVTKMSAMFQNCSSLTSIDISSYDMSHVTNVVGMFQGCSNIETLDISCFYNASSLFSSSSYGSLFSGMTSLKKIIAKNWIISSSFTHVFFRSMGGGPSIEEIDVTGWNLSNTTDITGMFGSSGSNGTGLKRIVGLNTWGTSHITNMQQIFSGLSSLTTLDLSSFDTSNVTNTDDMFKDCTSLTTGYAKTSADATKLNSSSNKPSGVTFVVKT